MARFKRNSLRETRLTISPIPETSLFPSGIPCYCQTIFPFSNESPLYSCLSPLLFVILFSFQTINFHEGKNKRGNTSLRNSRYRLRLGNDLGRIPALTKIRPSSRRKIHPQPVKEKPVPRLFIGGSSHFFFLFHQFIRFDRAKRTTALNIFDTDVKHEANQTLIESFSFSVSNATKQ